MEYHTTPRERILNLLERKPVDRTPVGLWFVSDVLQALYQITHTDNELSLWRALGIDKWAWANPACSGPLAPKEHGAAFVNHWGIQFKLVQSGPLPTPNHRPSLGQLHSRHAE
ncbi:MAG: hypothetical protein N2595_03155 [bacterium]|nr:hypothetical protein [bacterium]